MSAIPVIYSFARSGGTLVNQLLGAHPHCLVLSEINPAASYKPVVEQAVEWLGLVSPQEAADFSCLPYHQKILTLYNRSTKQGRKLVVRDWVTVNFLPGCAGDIITPSGQLEQESYLEHAGLKSRPLVIARKSASVYESIKHNFLQFENLGLEIFAEAYLQYARAVRKFPIIHMETLRAQPHTALMEILQCLGIDSDDSTLLLNKFHNFKNCTGNITLQTAVESAAARQILPPEILNSKKSAFADTHTALVEADRLLSYD